MPIAPTEALAALAALAVVGSAAGFLGYATHSAGSQLCGPTLVAPPHAHQLALTFDDGPNPAVTPYLLDILAEHNVRATFFLIGTHVLAQPALTRQIAAAGHVIGNHTMHHPRLTRHRESTIRAELAGCNQALEQTLGHPVTLFRPPHGARRPAVIRIARQLGLQTVQWNLIVGDWKPIDAAEILSRLEHGITRNAGRGQGTNVVLHDGGQHTLTAERMPTVHAVRDLLDQIRPDTHFVTPPNWT